MMITKLRKKSSREEEKNRNSHHPKRSPQYLFQVEDYSEMVHVFCIPQKQIKTYLVDFKFCNGMGFYHVENSFFLAGGTPDWLSYFFEFRKILSNGGFTQLHKMPTPKGFFAMSLWK